MSVFRPDVVWSERETGDFEACVAASYAMGLAYGGVPMAAPYTQAERERLEVVTNEPQDLNTTDTKALAVYGVKLRLPSVGTVSAFLSRPGIGACLTGIGSPGGFQAGTFTHEVFVVVESSTSVLLYDPLAPIGSAPKRVTVAKMVAWAQGVRPNDAREVRKDEFGGKAVPLITNVQPVAPNSSAQFEKGVNYQFWRYDPATGAKQVFTLTPPAATSAPTTARVTFVGEQPAFYFPRVFANGFKDDAYCAADLRIASPQVDCSALEAQVAQLTADLAAAHSRIAEIEAALGGAAT
jgi:hypothetical protein